MEHEERDAKISAMEKELAALKQLCLSQGAFNVLLCQLLRMRRALTDMDVALIMEAYKKPPENMTAAELRDWAADRFKRLTGPGQSE